MLCTDCNGENGQDHRFCVHCGILLREAPTTPQFRREQATVAEKPGSDPDRIIAPISAAAIIALFAVSFILTGADLRTIPALLLFFFPLIVGEVIFLRRSEKPVAMIRGIEAWARGKGETDVHSSGLAHKRLFEPLFHCVASVMQRAESIMNPHLRTGLIISTSLYIIGFIVYVTLSIAAAVIPA